MDQLISDFSSSSSSIAYLPSLKICIILAFPIACSAFFLYCRQNWPNSPPGPIGWPIFGYLPYLTGRLHEDFFRLAKEYGPFFSIKMGQRPAIVVSSPEVVREIFKHKDLTISSRSVTEAIRCVTYDGTTLVFVPYGARWRLLRKIMTTEVLSARAMELFQPVRRQQVHGLLTTMYSSATSQTEVNIADTLFILSSNIISNLLCSKNLFDVTKKEGRELKEMVEEVFKIVGLPNITDMVPLLKLFYPKQLKKRMKNVAKWLDNFFDNLVEERLEAKKKGIKINENGRLDLLDVFLDYRSNKKDDAMHQFSRVDTKGMLMDLFVAGTDPISSTVEWGMVEILKKPEIHKKILSELDQVVGKDRYVEETDIPKFTYFQAVVKEIFRLHPTGPLLIPRRTDEACEVFGYHIPKHCTVFVNVWGIARDPNVWKEPNEFKPERFIGLDIDVKGQDFELLPFGTGRRSCAGMPLGHRMVHFVLASLLQAYEWDLPLDVFDDMSSVGNTLRKVKSLVGIPKPRLSLYV